MIARTLASGVAAGFLALGLQLAGAQAPDAPPAVKSLKLPVRTLGPAMTKEYPPASVRAREQGTVRISACVEADRRLTEVTVVRSSGFKRLDDATLKVLKQQKAEPEKDAGGKAIRSCGWTADIVWAIIG